MSSRTRHSWISALAIATGVFATALTILPVTAASSDDRGGQRERGWQGPKKDRPEWRRDNASNVPSSTARDNRPNNGPDNRRDARRENRSNNERLDRGASTNRFNSAPNDTRRGITSGNPRDNRSDRRNVVRDSWAPATANGWSGRDNVRRDRGDRSDHGRTVREYRTLPYRDSRGYRLDRRYHHNHYYPPRGYSVTVAPRGAVIIRHGGVPYHYYHGSWYRPYGPRFVVVSPPIGLFVSTLPPYYSTLWVRGTPYYYADDVYYSWWPERHGYVVTERPDDADIDEESLAPPSDDIFIYPKNGQSEEQQAEDRYECHSWAADQTGFDPTQPMGGVSESETESKRDDYYRAMTACLEGRGYSVK